MKETVSIKYYSVQQDKTLTDWVFNTWNEQTPYLETLAANHIWRQWVSGKISLIIPKSDWDEMMEEITSPEERRKEKRYASK